jgi:polar amino acid transport system substrate-binding protein
VGHIIGARKAEIMGSGFRIFLLAILFASHAGATDVVLLTEGFPPYNYEERNGLVTGFSTEIVREICKRTQDCGDIALLSWNRAYALVQRYPYHALFSVYRRPERENTFKWVGPLAKAKVVFFARRDADLRISSIDDARHVKSIGVQKDSVHHLYLQNLGFSNLVVTAASNKEIGNTNLLMLLAGRFDLWMATEMSGYDKLARMGVSRQEIKPIFTLFTEDLYIAFNSGTPDTVISRWQAALEDMHKDPVYNRLIEKFLQ